MKYESDHTGTANSQWNESAPAVPRILNASPGNRDQEAGSGCEEECHTNPVDFLELAEKGAVLYVELEEERDQDGANAEEREVYPENPAEADVL